MMLITFKKNIVYFIKKMLILYSTTVFYVSRGTFVNKLRLLVIFNSNRDDILYVISFLDVF